MVSVTTYEFPATHVRARFAVRPLKPRHDISHLNSGVLEVLRDAFSTILQEVPGIVRRAINGHLEVSWVLSQLLWYI